MLTTHIENGTITERHEDANSDWASEGLNLQTNPIEEHKLVIDNAS